MKVSDIIEKAAPIVLVGIYGVFCYQLYKMTDKYMSMVNPSKKEDR